MLYDIRSKPIGGHFDLQVYISSKGQAYAKVVQMFFMSLIDNSQ
jgi:hypothetical protein